MTDRLERVKAYEKKIIFENLTFLPEPRKGFQINLTKNVVLSVAFTIVIK